MGLFSGNKRPQKQVTVSSCFELKAIEQLDDDLFIVHSTLRQRRVLRTHRTMLVVRQDQDLTLINPVRLNTEGERKLRKLGNVRRVVRLSCAPGQHIHDEHYQRVFHARLWSPEVHERLSRVGLIQAADDSPVPCSTLFIFQDTRHPEAAIVLHRCEGNILVTSKALQHQRDNPFINTPTWTKMQMTGLLEDLVVISPTWLKANSPRKRNLRDDFERLLRLDFDQVIGASGTLLPVQGKEAVVIAVERAFPVWD